MSFKCGWCATAYSVWQNRCDRCGGRMPPRPGMELGEEPPGLPRTLPKGYALRRYFTANTVTILGLVLLVMGLIPALLLLLILPWAALLPAILAVAGLVLLQNSVRTAAEALQAFRHGLPIAGEVVAVERVTTESIDRVHPWKLVYRFTLEGRELHGSVVAYDDAIRHRRVGQPLWVLYLQRDPAIHTVYPPFG